MKRVIVIGSEGQDGRLLIELLNRKHCEIIGIHREGIEGAPRAGNFSLVDCVNKLLATQSICAIYYLAAHHQSSSKALGDTQAEIESCFETNTLLFSRILNAVRIHSSATKVFYAASCHMYEGNQGAAIKESEAYRPKNIYAISKAAATEIANYYRLNHGVYVTVGIMFNHESHLRPESFLTRAVISKALAIANGETTEKILIARPGAIVDWGYASDYMEAIYELLLLPESGNYNVASGRGHTVEAFVRTVVDYLGLNYEQWVEIGGELNTPQRIYIGDSSKLSENTSWSYRRDFDAFVRQLVDDINSNRSSAR